LKNLDKISLEEDHSDLATTLSPMGWVGARDYL